MSTSTSGRSAAYLLLFFGITFFVGALTLTLINPFWNGLENSLLFDFGTVWWQDFADWAGVVHDFIGLLILVAILYTAFVATRDPV